MQLLKRTRIYTDSCKLDAAELHQTVMRWRKKSKLSFCVNQYISWLRKLDASVIFIYTPISNIRYQNYSRNHKLQPSTHVMLVLETASPWSKFRFAIQQDKYKNPAWNYNEHHATLFSGHKSHYFKRWRPFFWACEFVCWIGICRENLAFRSIWPVFHGVILSIVQSLQFSCSVRFADLYCVMQRMRAWINLYSRSIDKSLHFVVEQDCALFLAQPLHLAELLQLVRK